VSNGGKAQQPLLIRDLNAVTAPVEMVLTGLEHTINALARASEYDPHTKGKALVLARYCSNRVSEHRDRVSSGQLINSLLSPF
jgi:hypothetical protein